MLGISFLHGFVSSLDVYEGIFFSSSKQPLNLKQRRKEKRKRTRDTQNSSRDTCFPINETLGDARTDALEGRELALKRLQEKLEQFKGEFSQLRDKKVLELKWRIFVSFVVKSKIA